MKKALIALFSASTLLISAFAANADDAPQAPTELVQEFTEMCLGWATDDDISGSDLKPYVLKCVNDELEAEGYKKVKDITI